MAKRMAMPSMEAAVRVMRERLDVSETEGLTPDQAAAADAVRGSLKLALAAARGEGDTATGRGPFGWWRRWREWWHGTLIETSYAYLHAARVQMIDVYDEVDLRAEVPSAVARVEGWLKADDPRHVTVDTFGSLDAATTRATLRRLVEDGYDVSDRQHSRLRSFRNIVLVAVGLTTLVVALTVVLVANAPSSMPLCFPQPPADGTVSDLLSCPSMEGASAPQGQDVVVVALAGLVGGAIGTVVNIRNLRGTSASYDVPVALAVLKLPLGALTAIAGVLLVHGAFIPGLSSLDSQDQILAYALLFGVAQQAFTRLLDQKAQSLLNGLQTRETQARTAPSTGSDTATTPVGTPGTPGTPGTAGTTPTTGTTGMNGTAAGPGVPDEGETDATAAEVLAEPEPEPVLLDNPEGDETDQVQDDDSAVMPDAPARDHS
jgi:hypothetical protein